MKRILEVLGVAIALAWATVCPAETLMTAKGFWLNTEKVAHVYGPITGASFKAFQKEILATENLPGPRVVIIDSPGGEVDAGRAMIDLLKLEAQENVAIVCVVRGKAASMAFNLLTLGCSVRLVEGNAVFLAHKIRAMPPPQPLTAKNLRDIAKVLEMHDEEFRQTNAEALGLTLKEYDKVADAERSWTAEELLKRGYLQDRASLAGDTHDSIGPR